MKPRDEGKDFVKEFPADGLQHAMCYAVIDLGKQRSRNEQYPKPKFQIAILFELEERMKEGNLAGQRFGTSIILTNSCHPKSALFKLCKAWLGIEINGETELDDVMIEQGALLLMRQEPSRKDPTKTYCNMVGTNPPMTGFVPWPLENGKEHPDWMYPKYLCQMRSEALEPPGDTGCRWEQAVGTPPTGDNDGTDFPHGENAPTQDQTPADLPTTPAVPESSKDDPSKTSF